ncbi:hypothetical protein [Ktedonospora formicarum]|uniref:Uncharacterized protein n=1 Tax=Ktedonospora formicarum TaxID=2778364 RepID=A0A8J3I0P4_9CHLR|nr:hypothetical protein [Ktedonospora formicarum]GHO42744.1 hypothetical protein KSX_09070 [Ktedonospora formicarum]
MMPSHIALISETDAISTAELTRVAAALQKQVTRDFTPLWNIEGTVDAFSRLEDVPLGYNPVIVRANVPDHALGFHLDEQGQPYAIVQYSHSWSLSASHEVLELLADAYGNCLVAGPSLKKDHGRVQYLLGICDPCQGADFAYTVNDILVSDFVTPSYYEPVRANGERYSYTGAVQEPRQVLPGGYITWYNASDGRWWQFRHLGIDGGFVDFGASQQHQQRSGLREFIDRQTPRTPISRGLPNDSRKLQTAREAAWITGEKTAIYAQKLHQQIDSIMHDAFARV